MRSTLFTLGFVTALFLGCSGSDDPTGDAPDVGEDGTSTDTSDGAPADSSGPIDSSVETDGSSDDATADADDGKVDDATDADDATESGDASDAGDVSDVADGDATVVDSAPETRPDTAFDAAYDTSFEPPSWSPVCIPPPPPPPPSDAGVDADADADAGDDAFDAAADTGVDAADTADALDDGSDVADAAGLGDAPDATDAADATVDSGACTPTATRVRIVASNLTSGSSSNYDLPGIHILQALHPDVVLMQEFKYPAGLRALVDTTFGTSFNFVVSPGAIPNGIVSRYPIMDSGIWDDPDLTDREWVWARIDVPGSRDLWAVSTHLRTTSATARDAEAKNLLAYVKANVPSDAYLVIGGDFNTVAPTEQALLDLVDVVTIAAPYAVDQAGNNNTNAPRNKSYDWVLPSAPLFSRMIPVIVGAASYPAGLVVDTRVYTPISDLAPAVATDSAATNMQHMAIVRDFALGD